MYQIFVKKTLLRNFTTILFYEESISYIEVMVVLMFVFRRISPY